MTSSLHVNTHPDRNLTKCAGPGCQQGLFGMTLTRTGNLQDISPHGRKGLRSRLQVVESA